MKTFKGRFTLENGKFLNGTLHIPETEAEKESLISVPEETSGLGTFKVEIQEESLWDEAMREGKVEL